MNDSKMLSNISSEVKVGMDEVVNVFVSKYEDDLYEKKNGLSKEIKMLDVEIVNEHKVLENLVDKKDYVLGSNVLNLVSEVKSLTVNVDEVKGEVKIVVSVGVFEKDKRNYSSLNQRIEFVINNQDSKKLFKLKNEVDNLRVELLSVMNLIKDISRKERKIRSKISEMKLKESGFETLLESKEMLKLIEIDD